MELRFGPDAPRVSVITVFNRLDVLERRLLPSLRAQAGTSFEWIGVDNTGSAHASAALALNAGARRARGAILLFIHQDVSLYGERWIAELVRWMLALPDVGVAGVIGPRADDGQMVGFMRDRKAVVGHPLHGPAEVQTLDECVLAMRREVYDLHPFDESIGGWHVYGVDACLRTRRAGMRTYVLPLFVHHDSAAVNLAGLAEAHERMHREHGPGERTIFTTCGVIGSPRARFVRRARGAYRWGIRRTRKALGLPFADDYLGVVQALAEGRERVLVLDFFQGEPSRTWPREIEAEALDGKAASEVAVRHRVLLPGDSVVGGPGGQDAPGARTAVLVFNLPRATPEQLGELRAGPAAGTAGIWVVFPAGERDRVRARAAEHGWKLAGERATRPFSGPGPVFVAELRR